MITASLVLTLAPGVLFGHAQGEPTTAARTRIGRIETDTFDSATNDPPNLPIRCSPPPVGRATQGDANVVGMKETALSFVQRTST